MPKIIARKAPVAKLNQGLPQGTKKKYVCLAGGLVLEIRGYPSGIRRNWLFRSGTDGAKLNDGKPFWISIGRYPEVSQDEARVTADKYFKLIKEGVDPRFLHETEEKSFTVEDLFNFWLEDSPRLRQLKNPAKTERDSRQRFASCFSEQFRSMEANAVSVLDVSDAIRDVWGGKNGTAVKILRDLKLAFDYALDNEKVKHGNPIDIGRLERLLGKAQGAERNQPALGVDRIPELFLELSKRVFSTTALGLAYNILTASRPGSLFKGNNALQTGAVDSELEEFTTNSGRVIAVQRIPGIRMKGQKAQERLIPLSSQAQKILQRAMELRPEGAAFIFCTPNTKKGTCITVDSLRVMLRRMNNENPGHWVDPSQKDPATGEHYVITAHGTSRATFRDWATNPVRYHHPVFAESDIELCLSHITAKYGTSYARDPRIEQLLEIFEEWGRYCFSLIDAAKKQ